MCGIAGILAPGPDAEPILNRMISSLSHRGPDATGLYLDGDAALGHCRLSIVGLGDGGQPICNEDGTLWIVYNGEVFNYPELREELQKKGHRFSTGTDTEVLVHLYEEYGSDFLPLVNGQFAFAIWDSRRKELFLARDRVGIRPLYYCRSGKRFLFASEIKALMAHPEIPRELDPVGLHQVFTFWTTLTPRTVFRGIRELPAGHHLLVRDGVVLREAPFWRIPYYPPEERLAGSLEEAMEELRLLLLDAVRIQLRADVPVGAYLSGGLDSSIITSLIAGHFNNRLRTFSLGFEEAAFDETPYQEELVRHLGTEHRRLLINNGDIREHFPQVLWHCEKPLLRTAPVPMFLLSRLARENSFKVVLTGEGADEVFGGYDIFKEEKIRRFWSAFPASTLRPRLLEKLHPYIFQEPGRSRMMLQRFYGVREGELGDPCFSHRIRWRSTGKNQAFFSAEILAAALGGYDPESAPLASLPADFPEREPLARAQHLEMEIFLTNYLLSSQGDRVAMGNSLELRVPFLDNRVIDFAARLPPRWKIRGLNEKYILKKAFRGTVPPRIAARVKHPYRAPIREVFFSGPCPYVDELLSERALRRTGYFNVPRALNLVAKYRKGETPVESEIQNMALVGILSTQLVHHHFIDAYAAEHFPQVEITKKVLRR